MRIFNPLVDGVESMGLFRAQNYSASTSSRLTRGKRSCFSLMFLRSQKFEYLPAVSEHTQTDSYETKLSRVSKGCWLMEMCATVSGSWSCYVM